MTPAEARRARSTARWQRLRSRVLDEHPLCAPCLREGRIEGAAEVDHVRPIMAGGLFWATRNLQPICRPCHERKTAAELRSRAAWICLHGYGPGECQRCEEAPA